MTNTTPQPLPSVEEVVETFKDKLDSLLPETHEEFKGHHFLSIVDLFRTTLTARDAAHQEAMGEMVEEINETLQTKLASVAPTNKIHAIVKAIARYRGVLEDTKN